MFDKYFVNQLVTSPYGNGRVLECRQDDKIIKIVASDWKLDRNQFPIFYMNPKDIKPVFDIGCAVTTSFGDGIVKDIRSVDGIYVVHLNNWQLANNSIPILYLNEYSLKLASVNKVDIVTKTTSFVDECIAKAKVCKAEANSYFNLKEFEKAKEKYMDALSKLRIISDNSSNIEKARGLEQIIPCNNNIAICSFKLKNYLDCIIFASNVSIQEY